MTLYNWLVHFWKRAYGRKLSDLKCRRIQVTQVIATDSERIAVLLITEYGGARKIWMEVSP